MKKNILLLILMILTLAFATKAQEIKKTLVPGDPPQNFSAGYDEGLSDPTPEVEVTITGTPEIAISPDSLSEVHTNPPQITMQELTITNTGDLNLEWELTITPERVVKSNKTPLDPEVYHQLLAERMAAEGRTLPHAEAEQSPVDPRKMKNNADAQWDVEYTFSAQAPSCQAVATDGEYFYLTYWNGTGEFDKFDMDGNFIESFTISEAPAIRDFAYDGEYFYGAPNGGMTIAQLDLANQTVVSTIPISSSAGVTGARHLAYDPDLDYGSGGFWLGQWGELAAVDMSGNALVSNSETPNPYNCYGSAYDMYSDPGSPKLWLFTQNAGASPNDLVMLEEFDIGTLSFTGFTLDLYTMKDEIPGYIPGTVTDQTIAGGAFIYQDEYLRYILAVNIQQSPNLVVGLELAQAYVPNDVCVYSIVEPASGVSLGNNEPVTITIRNFGFLTQTEIPWEVSYTGPTGAGTFTGIWTGSLAINESVDVTLAETIDMSVFGDYEIEACTLLEGDENQENDCKSKTITHTYQEYCNASTTTEDEWIANVTCGNIDNSSGWQGGVADYTDITTNIPAGESESITITNGNAWESDSVTIWVDWNMDYEFGVGTNEEFFTTNVGGTGETFVGEIIVPDGTPDGDYRMRVRMTYSSAPEPCGEASYGEVEDYTIHVGEIPAGWLMVDQTSGVILPGESDTIMVSFDSEGLNVGSYNSALLITSNAQNNPLVEVPCSLQVSFETQSLVFEPFEDYNAGDYLVEQAIAQGKEYWTTWSGQPGSEEDPMVSDEQAFAGSNAMIIQQGNDAILQLPQIFGQGVFQVNFEILVPSGKTGYFNCLQLYDGGDSEWGMQCFFDIDGQGSVDAGGEGTGSFSYDYDTWNLVQLQIDLDSDHAKMFLNEEQIVEWQWSTGSFGSGTLNEFHALNFYGWDETGTPGAFFDNISIEADIPPIPDPPTNLQAVVEDNEVILFWNYAGIFDPQWISYSGYNVTNSIGLDEPLNFDVAARWDSQDLEQFSNGAVTRIGFVPGEPDDVCTYTLKVWSGFDNPTLIYSQELSGVEADVWNDIELDSPVPFDNEEGLWIGFNCNTTAGYPAGCDDGPQVEGYSNMIYRNDAWTTLTGLSPDLTYNWAVQGLLEYSDGEYVLDTRKKKDESLTFNVYMALDNEPFNLIAYGLTETQYVNSYAPDEMHIYYVTAVNEYGGESEPSNQVTVYVGPPAPDPPYNLQYEIVDDSVHLFWQQSAPGLVNVYYVYRDGQVIGYPGEPEYYDPLPNQFPVEYYVAAYSFQYGLTDTSNHVIVHNPQGIMEQNTNIHLFPNPSDEHFTIDANSRIIGIAIFNYKGHEVYSVKPSASEFQINTSGFPPGIYTLQVEMEQGVVVRKVVVQ